MSLWTPEESRARNAYRRTLFVALIIVAVVTVWATRRPPKATLAPLRALHPKRITSPVDEVDYEFTQPPAEVAKILDAQLHRAARWSTSGFHSGFGDYYEDNPPNETIVSISPLGKSGTMMVIRRPDKDLVLP